MEADGAWCRWVLCFLKRPRRLLDRIATALRPGGVLVLHEYFNYGTWRLIPASAEFEEFVGLVMQSWRDEGGEPDIGLKLPIWLAESGFTVQAVQPIIDVFPPTNLTWQWPKTFFQAGLRRLLQTRHLDEVRARQMADAFARCEATPHALMISPAVLEIIAVRRN
jgi:SAM-dependent methyltransferase